MSKVLFIALGGLALAGGAAFMATRQTPEDHLERGKASLQSGDGKSAAIELRNVLQQRPEHGEARYLLGRVLLAAGDYAGAEKELSRARALAYPGRDLPRLLGRVLLALDQPKRLLAEVVEQPGADGKVNAGILGLRAQAHLHLQDEAAALRSLDEAEARAANQPDSLVARAMLAFARNQAATALILAGQAVKADPERADILVLRADILRAQGRQAEALADYARALVLEPGNIPARLATAQIQVERNELEKAQASLGELRKIAPNNLIGRYLAAMIDHRQGRQREARDKLQSVLASAPNFPAARLLAGMVDLSLGNREGARTHLNKVLEADPEHALARKLMAATLVDMGETGQAAALMASLREAGNDPLLHTLAGRIALRRGDYDEASRHFEQASVLTPGNPALFLELATSRLGSGDKGGALAALTKAAELDTQGGEPDVLLVLTHLREGRYDAALAAVERLDKKQPGSALTQHLRGTVLVARRDPARARAAFEQAVKIDPGYFPAVVELARLDLQKKDAAAARGRFEALLKHNPRETRAWIALANLADLAGDDAGLRESLRQAKAVAPRDETPRLMLIKHWLKRNEPIKAQAEAREALDATGNADFHEFVGLAQMAQGDHAAARTAFSQWLKARPAHPPAALRLAQAQSGEGDNAGALKTLELALVKQPDFTEARLLQALLLSRSGKQEEALKIVRAVKSRQPGAAPAYLAEADILLADKRHAEAGSLYARAAQLTGQGAYLIRAGQALLLGSRRPEAEALLGQWLQSHAEDALVRHQLARSLMDGGRLKEARVHLDYLARRNPRDLTALNNLAWVQGELGLPAARATAEKAFTLAPEHPATLDTLGWILVKEGQYARGLEMLDKALAQLPNSPDIRWHRAYALAGKGDSGGAKRELERLFATGLAFPQENEARNLLQRLR